MTPRLVLASAPILIPLFVTLGYGLMCWVAPFRTCRRCQGMGRRRTKLRRAPRPCRPCRGTGRRLRAGRWIANHVIRIRREAHR
ncbi:hypothetical protein [Rugosimonospora africana]|uniref:Uncharacterized protein n=1 Tax=Rugosimonospora africana TaxID=556532 RepID=A0A8J3R4T2_9ACTN|nr:hypothetical protein [Rugosimonospora africana]GIH21482.1 hypothetical protein Raf01_96540 [Rugosimonospora africana]